MVVISSPTPLMRGKKTRAIGIPIIDLSLDRSTLSDSVVKACEEYGFFKVVNHGIPNEIISRMENEGLDFFKKPATEKQKAGPPTPFGYGLKNIGTHGDMGELEYLLLQANPEAISERSRAISDDPTNFSCAVNDYIEAVKNLTCELLNLVAQGLRVPDRSVFSSLINNAHSDSCFRVNYYPRLRYSMGPDPQPNFHHHHAPPTSRIGFGEHSDPQILTVLRSNDVGGLQICTGDGLWVPVPPGPNELCVFVGDALQVLTNGRFESVRHRVMANTSSAKARLSMIYFGAPSLNGWISPILQTISTQNPIQYKSFTWGEYKKAAYSLRLGEPRVDLFKLHPCHTDKKM